MIRDEWHFDAAEMGDFFFVRVLGGEWTLARQGVAADSVGEFAQKGVASDWCRAFAFSRQQTFLSLDRVE